MERQYLTELRKVLSERFSESELQTLYFDLKIDYADLPGEGKADKARELVTHCERHSLVSELIEKGKQLRPDIEWPNILELVGPLPPKPFDWSRLQQYLPVDMYQEIQETVPHRREKIYAERCIDHLYQLLRTVVTYLPRHLAIELLQKPVVAENKGQFLEGTLLFVDIADFTRLSEELRDEGGEEGAEKLAQIINEYLDVMLCILFKYDGRLIRFSGDGMLCLFAGQGQGAMNAVWTAWEMKQAIAEQLDTTKMFQEVTSLNMKAGSNSGRLFAASIGTAAHMEYILTGSAVERTAQAESAAHEGDVLISRETYELVKASVDAEKVEGQPDFLRVTAIQTKPVLGSGDPWHQIEGLLTSLKSDLWGLVDRLDALTLYLPTGVLPHLVYEPWQVEIEGQYRQVTVLFANFSGMDKVIRVHSDDEVNVTAALSQYFQAIQKEIQDYGGVVNKVDLYEQGDKLMVLFGAPMAHGKDIQRAALTALKMQEAMGELSFGTANLLKQRIGINTGLVFAGNVRSSACNRREYTVMGSEVNLAARLMEKADPGQGIELGQILMSQSVWEQIQENFEAEASDPIQVEGLQDPIHVYVLRKVRIPRENRISRVIHSAMVGREEELMRLQNHLRDLKSRKRKRIIAVTGEAGVGKSRLVREWQQWAHTEAGNSVTWLTGGGRAYGQKTNGIFIEIVEHLLAFADNDTPEERRRKLSNRIEEFGWLDDYLDKMAFLGHFLGLDRSKVEGSAERVEQLDTENRQLQVRLAVWDLLERASQEGPLVLMLENLQWADAASLDMLEFVWGRLRPRTPVLVCLIYRPQVESRIRQIWLKVGRPDHEIALRELRGQHNRQLLFNLMGNSQPPQAFVDLVLGATDGNPLYVEEVLRALIEEGAIVQDGARWQVVRDVEQIRVPRPLRQIIQSRIDELDFRSPGARRVLWMAAVIGKEFTEDVLKHLFTCTARSEEELWQHLDELTRRADMIREVKAGDEGHRRWVYQFRHDLVHQAAYENMLVARRREYHCEVGRWLEKKHGEELERHYHTLAYHYDRGWLWDKAFHYHWLAGQRDARTYANQDAVFHLGRALEIASYLSRDTLAVGQVHFEMGKVLATLGEFDDALEQLQAAYDRFREVGARVSYHIGRVLERQGSEKKFKEALKWQGKGLGLLPSTRTPEAALLHVLGGIVTFRAGEEFDRVLEESKRAFSNAKAAGERQELGMAHRMRSFALRHKPERSISHLKLAVSHCKKSIAICKEMSDLIGLGTSFTNQSVIAWDLGDWQLAVKANLEAIEILERVGDRPRLAMTYCNLADKYRCLGDLEQGLDYARRGLDISTKIGYQPLIALARIAKGSLRWRQGRLEQAQEQLLKAQELVEEGELKPTVGRWLAQVYLSRGKAAKAVAEIQEFSSQPPEKLGVEAEPIKQLWAQILAAQGNSEEAVDELYASLERLEKRPAPYHAACAHLVLVRVLRRRSDRTAEALTHAEAARSIFKDLDAKLDLEETNDLIAELKKKISERQIGDS